MADRISEMIHALAQVGAEHGGGVSRLALSRLEREAHGMVADWLIGIGLEVHQDAIGNTIAVLPGEGGRAIGVGSHLDSVPLGGRFDGVVGVVAAIEVARAFAQRDRPLSHELRVVAFAAEEGARFGQACIGSKAVAGHAGPRDLDRLRDKDGITAAEALRDLDRDPRQVATCRWRPQDWAAFLELHIEQASVLESSQCPIGIVDLVSGSTRIEFRITGQAQHSGGTPMAGRRDALAAAADVVQSAERLAHGPRYRGTRTTVGRLDVHPNSITTIPGRVTFTVDVRDVDSDRQRRAAREIIRDARATCERRGLDCDVEVIADASPTVLPVWLREQTMATCEALGIEYRVMPSGASHDAQIVNGIVPSGLIFIPSKDGLSHVPEEWSSAADIERGVRVLIGVIEHLDEFLVNIG